jgi:hypothetical protein
MKELPDFKKAGYILSGEGNDKIIFNGKLLLK